MCSRACHSSRRPLISVVQELSVCCYRLQCLACTSAAAVCTSASAASACRNLVVGDGGYEYASRELLGGREASQTATEQPTIFDSKNWELFKRHAFRVIHCSH